MPIHHSHLLPIEASCPSPFLENWVQCQSSLTDKLRQMTGDATLKRLSQQWTHCDEWSKVLLSLEDKRVFQREILMLSEDRPYWYARSIIPNECYRTAPDFFNRLESESIRSLIFESQEVQRIHFVYYAIDERCVEFYWLQKYLPQISGTHWMRVSEFSFRHLQSFYLAEIMLPNLQEISG